ncbi:clarin-3 [Engraulis encrasicolus]|uniref:clarin-3 n=1 Tax=Engraulis encrasicolus TaxID=184585 RepID=UPI002FD0B0EB
MPSLKKTLYFLSSCLCCAGGVAMLGYGMSDVWSTTSVLCKSDNNTAGAGFVIMGLFSGVIELETCPYIDTTRPIQVLEQVSGASMALQYIVLGLLVLALFGSAGSILITLYNSISNPYETYMGPMGLYVCSGCSVGLSFLALIFYLCLVHLVDFAVQWIKELAITGDFSDVKVVMHVGFYMVLPYMAVNLLAILLVYLYVHAAYTEKKAQQKPTDDDQDDEGIMY